MTPGGNIIFVALIDTCFPVSISSAFIKLTLNLSKFSPIELLCYTVCPCKSEYALLKLSTH